MTTTPTKAEKSRILLDLKPALDGYAGIPQETRLLFRGLRSMDSCDVEGLIQHGARKLRSAVPPRGKQLPASKQINRLSRVVVSLYEKPYSSVDDTLVDAIDHYFSRSLLRGRALIGLSIHPGVFESALFDDFMQGSHGDEERGGFGLGLASARRMAMLMQGEAGLDSSWFGGCAFFLELEAA